MMSSSDTKATPALKAVQGLLLNDFQIISQAESCVVPLAISFVLNTLQLQSSFPAASLPLGVLKSALKSKQKKQGRTCPIC